MRVLPVRFLRDAQLDLQEIAGFLQSNGASDAIVDGYFGRIIDRANSIGNAPEGYPLMAKLGPNVRMVPFEHSAWIAYRITEDAVEIIRVFYGGQDL